MDKEELFDENNFRYTILPIKYHDIWNMYKKQEKSRWIVEEVDMSHDAYDWDQLNKNEQHFLKYILAFFAASDGIVSLNLTDRFIKDVKIVEAIYFYNLQSAMENVHSEMYSILIDTYIKDIKEKEIIINAITTIPCIGKKAKWAEKWIDSSDSYAKRLIAFIIVEGVFFSGAFCSIFWLNDQKSGKLPGLVLSNEWISRDEHLHCVVPETNILTNTGYKKIIDCIGIPTTIWNGTEWSEVTPFKTGTQREIIKIELDNGITLECTKQHEWLVASDETKTRQQKYYKFIRKNAEDLVVGDILQKYEMPVIDVKDPDRLYHPYTQGLFSADGTYEHKYRDDGSLNPGRAPLIKFLRDDKKKLIKHIHYNCFTESDARGYMVIRLNRIKTREKTFVPINYSINTKLTWLAGFVDGDGHLSITKSSGKGSIEIGSIELQFLKDIQLMLSTLGCISGVKLGEKAHKKMIKGKEYECKDIYRLTITSNDVIKLIKLGFAPKRIDLSKIKTDQDITSYAPYVRVKNIINEGRISDTYCFTEPKNHTGIFNGVMTGQCQFGALLYSKLKNKLTEKEVHKIFEEAIEIEIEFICEALDCKLIGINAGMMSDYIKYVGDRLLTELGYKKMNFTKNPFTFMEKISLQNKTDFFTGRVANYQPAAIENVFVDNKLNITLDF